MKNILCIIFIVKLIFSFTLIQAQVPAYVPANGLLAWYPFKGNAADDSGNGHNGIVNGAVPTTDRFNTPIAAYLYDGTNDYISVADNLNFRPENFTISSWVSFSTPPNGYHLIVAKNVGSGSPESIDMNYAASYGGWFCNIGAPGSNGPFLTPSYPVTVGTWYHFVYQFDDVNNVQKIYINGVFTASSVVNMSVGYDSQPWTFGMEYEMGVPSFFMNGKIDDIGIWDRILTPCEINELYTASVGSLSASASTSLLCAGQTATLSASGASTYTWNPGGFVSPSVVINPTTAATNIYTVTGTFSTGCLATQSVAITSTMSTLIALSSASFLCLGESATLTALGANSYTWNPGGLTGSVVVVSPNASNIYTVLGSDIFSCLGTQSIALSVTSESLSASPSASVLCLGQNATLSASGVSSYTWNPGGIVSPSIVISPTTVASVIYTVAGTDSNNCSSSKSVSVTVTEASISTNSSDSVICTGASATLSATGANSYTWNPGGIIAPAIVISPTVAAIDVYTVSGTDINGCEAVQFATVTVSDCTGLAENNNENKMYYIFPNPASQYVILKYYGNGNSEANIEIMDAVGKVLVQKRHTFYQNDSSLNLSVSDFASGLYFLKIHSENKETQNIKLIKE